MKNKWLNLVLRLTNYIYKRKQVIIGQNGIKVILNIISLVFLEVALSVLSLPLYLTLNSGKVLAYFDEKGSYNKVNFDYSLRRVLTVTGVSIIAFIWGIKLLLILFFPTIYGPLQLYSVSGLQPVDILNQSTVASETGIQTARSVSSIPKPTLTEVRKVKGENYSFFGEGQPNTTVVLLLSDISSAIYTANINSDGKWQIDHQQNNFKLKEGNHSVVIYSYDSKLGVRSETAPAQFFKVTVSWSDYLMRNLDILTNWLIIIILSIGLFLIFLTI
ncbi:MAG: hypothetical protein WAW11_04490 [Patescibacteria group bacterium]